ncbi:MAG: FkbM family methyltransferase, partial [Pseudomonadota bacterium]
ALAAALAQNIRFAGRDIRLFAHALGAHDGTDAYSPSQESFLAGRDTVETPVRRLTGVLAEAGITRIAALKIDVEGWEDRVLAPFLAEAPAALLPRALLIEHLARPLWQTDLVPLFRQAGYRTAFTNAHNTGYTRP